MKISFINEDILTEKKWVQVVSNANDAKPFLFYSTDDDFENDVKTLLPIIMGRKKDGTYKQQLNPKILNRLKKEYQSKKDDFKLEIINKHVNPNSIRDSMVLTLVDRDLRRKAQKKVGTITTREGIELSSSDYLVHHKKKGERNNSYSNIMLIGKNYGLDAAHAIHKLLENNPISSLTNSTLSIPIYEFDINSDPKEWYQSHTINISIK